MQGGDASPCDLPERVALDARASLARRVGASVARARREPFPNQLTSKFSLKGDVSNRLVLRLIGMKVDAIPNFV